MVILHVVISICTYYQLQEGSLIIYCNCKSAFNRLQKHSYGSIKGYLVADFDLLQEASTLLQQLKTNNLVTISWVKGHYNGEEKSVPQTFNETAHHLANHFLHHDMGYYNPSRMVIDPLLQKYQSHMINPPQRQICQEY